jgi:short-subunit dehydrogenase
MGIMGNEIIGKTILITGASSGIGEALARRLHSMGAQVIITARSVAKLERIAEELGSRTWVIPMDVADQQSVDQGIELAFKYCDKIDVLVNNAGYGQFEKVAEMDIQSISEMMNVNYLGMVRCTKAILPHMLSRRYGHIINVASVASKLATAKSAGYAATKYAMLGFTNALRQELDQSGVSVSALHPGPVRTPFFEIADPTGSYVQNVTRFMVNPEQVANAIVGLIINPKLEAHVPRWMGLSVKALSILPNSWVHAMAVKFFSMK